MALTLGVLAGCGNDERTALAIEDVRWRDKTSLVVSTECATDLATEVGPDHSGTGLPEVTVWGDPSMGTCRPTSVVVIPDGATRIVDGTTSMVIDLPARP